MPNHIVNRYVYMCTYVIIFNNQSKVLIAVRHIVRLQLTYSAHYSDYSLISIVIPNSEAYSMHVTCHCFNVLTSNSKCLFMDELDIFQRCDEHRNAGFVYPAIVFFVCIKIGAETV